MCGASKQQKQAYQNTVKVSQTLTDDFEKFFSQNEDILGNLRASVQPIVAAGPNQYGFSQGEDAAQRTNAVENIAQANREATDVTRSSLAARGGGNAFLPSGAEASIEAGLAQNEAIKQAEAQTAITAKGYDVGRENYERAVAQEAAIPGQLEAPVTSAGGVAEGGAAAESQSAEAITQANEAWMQPVGGLIGGLGGAALGRRPSGGGGSNQSVG